MLFNAIIFIAAVVYLIETILKIANYVNNLKPDKEAITIEKVQCQKCGKQIDIDFPKCPYCKYVQI